MLTKLKQHFAQKERWRWETAVSWYRLRYREAAEVSRCLYLLSQADACGRVALRFQPGAVARLWVGVANLYAPLLRQMATDFGFTLVPLQTIAIDMQPLIAVTDLPWKRPFHAHLCHGHLFSSGVAGGSAWPTPAEKGVRLLSLPQPPPVGLGLDGTWPSLSPLADLLAARPEPDRWLLGWGEAETMLSTAGNVNLYGSYAADWLTRQLTHTLAVHHAGLVVLDGRGDLVPRLKRQAAVTRLLGRDLSYVDMDGAAVVDGFDPLAPVPGESGAAHRARRARWMRQMGLHQAGLELLETAPLADLNALQKWLSAPAQQRQRVAAASLENILERLLSERQLRQWLEWPVNRYAILPGGTLIFTCREQGWPQQQLLLAVLLAACAVPDIRLVLHGLPWQQVDMGALPARTLVSNGPPLSDALPLLTACQPAHIPALAQRYLKDDPVLTEYLHLLRPGEGVICHAQGVTHTTWVEQAMHKPHPQKEIYAYAFR